MQVKALSVAMAGLSGLVFAGTPKVIVIAPDDLVEAWQSEYAAKVPAITGGSYEVVSTADIYAAHPYAAANTDGTPRNPAESIHAYIASRSGDVGQFILGGPWVDVNDLATNRVMKLVTGERLTLANTVPGVKIRPDDRYCSPTDMYYACPDAGNTYAWDANGDGVYLDSSEFASCDLTARVVVTRLPLVTWSEWRHADGTLFTQRELLAAYVAKLKKGLAADFDGANRYGIYGYLINESGVQQLGRPNEPWVERKETAFYDNGYNMFDPSRGTDDFWLVEGVSRRHVRDQIAQARPVDDVNGFLETTFNRDHADREAARSAWTNENYALRFYYAHGARGGGHGFGMNDYTAEGCGLTLFDDCAGPCSTGRIEFDANGVYQMNYAIACVMSPFGGSLATINNSDFGVYDANNYWKTFQPNDSWRYANNYLVGFVQSNLTVGAAWRYNVTDFVTNYKYNKSGLDTWMLAEEMLLGDPLVRLPAIEDGLDYGVAGVTYTGLARKTDVVVSLQVAGDLTLNTPSVPLKVMNGLRTGGTSLTICTAAGGIGGEGVVFTGAKGALTLAGDEPFYVAGVKNVSSLKVQGSHQTIDFDGVELDGSAMGQLSITSADDVTIRSATEGAFAKIRNNLSVPRGGSVRLATWNAFGEATDGVIYLAKDAELIIGANPWYHDGRDRGESLNATISVLSSTYKPRIRVEQGGYFTPVAPLATAGGVTYEVDARDGLGGEVTVPENARLALRQLPLSKIERLTVASGGTLEIPADKTIDDLVSSGVADLKAGAKIVCNGVTTTLAADREIRGADYVTKYYYTSGETDWTFSTRVSLEQAGAADQTVEAGSVVRFVQDFGPVYIHDDVACSRIEVAAGANLQVGYWNNRWTIPGNWTADLEEGAVLTIARWSNTSSGAVKVGDDVVVDGAGTVTFASTVTSVACGNISGTATILIPAGVTVTCTGMIANPIAVPEGCELLRTADGSSTVYRAVQRRTIYWDSTTKEEWSAAKGAPDFTDAAGNAVTYQLGDTVVVRRTSTGVLWLGAVADGVPFVIDGYAVQVENEAASGTTFAGSDVSVVNGGSIAYRSRWNGVKLKDATIHLEAGTSFGPYAQWSNLAVDIEGTVTFDGEGSISFGSYGIRLVTAASRLVVPVRTPALTVTCAVQGHTVISSTVGETTVYQAIPEEDRTLAEWALEQGLSYDEARSSARFDSEGNPLNAVGEAFLLNCAVEDAAIASGRTAFRFESFTPGEVPTIDASRFNGKVTIWGAPNLEAGGTWTREALETQRFFKATLTR